MTVSTVTECSQATARALTDQLRQSLATSWELLVEAYERRAWAALGYPSWDAYTDAELGETRLRLPREERREVVASMTEAGMSTRAIGSALGVDQKTVVNDRRREELSSPDPEPIPAGQTALTDDGDIVDAEIVDDDPLLAKIAAELDASDGARTVPELKPVLGTDGKTYTATPTPAQQRRRPLPEAFWDAAYHLSKITERLERLTDDDRFPKNADEVATRHRGDLIRALDALQGVINRLPTA